MLLFYYYYSRGCVSITLLWTRILVFKKSVSTRDRRGHAEKSLFKRKNAMNIWINESSFGGGLTYNFHHAIAMKLLRQIRLAPMRSPPQV